MTPFIFLILVVLIVFLLRARKRIFLGEKSSLLVYWSVKIGLLLIMIVVTWMWLVGSNSMQDPESSGHVVFVVDVSASMDVADIETDKGDITRKMYVRYVLQQYIAQYPGRSYAIIVFADEARTLIPFTSDPNILSTFLSHIEVFGALPGGSNFANAFLYTQDFLERRESEAKVVLISDGGHDFPELPGDIKMQDLAVLGVGTEKGGRVPDGVNVFGQVEYRVYQGSEVVSKRNDANLERLVGKYGGTYELLDNDLDLGLENTSDLTRTNSQAYVLGILLLIWILLMYTPWNIFSRGSGNR